MAKGTKSRIEKGVSKVRVDAIVAFLTRIVNVLSRQRSKSVAAPYRAVLMADAPGICLMGIFFVEERVASIICLRLTVIAGGSLCQG